MLRIPHYTLPRSFSGTVPVVHAVGGLGDTVTPFNPYENSVRSHMTYFFRELDRCSQAPNPQLTLSIVSLSFCTHREPGGLSRRRTRVPSRGPLETPCTRTESIARASRAYRRGA